MKFTMLKGSTGQPWTGFLFKTDDGHVIAFDGGCRDDTDNMLDALEKLTGDRCADIDLWLISHPHGDHYGTFTTINRRTKEGEKMPAAKMVAYYPLSNEYGTREAWCSEQMVEFNGIMAECPWPRMSLEKGVTFGFGNLTIETLLVSDPTETRNAFNNASCVFRLTEKREGKEDFTMILLGDLGVEGSWRLLAGNPPEKLKADAVQVAHHGQRGCPKAVYEAISPKYSFWATPDWLWDRNDGELSTVSTRSWFEAMGTEMFVPTDKNLEFDTESEDFVVKE